MFQMHGTDECVHMTHLHSVHKRAIQFLMPTPNVDYKQKCCALKLLPLGKQLLFNKCVPVLKVVHGKPPLKDLMIPSERLHLHGNKPPLPRTRILTSLKRVSPFQALEQLTSSSQAPHGITDTQKESISGTQ